MALVFEYNIHETREQTIQLLCLKTGARLSRMNCVGNETVNVLRGYAMGCESEAHLGPSVLTVEFRQSQTILISPPLMQMRVGAMTDELEAQVLVFEAELKTVGLGLPPLLPANSSFGGN